MSAALAVAAGGALGSLARYGAGLLLRPWSASFPWATLAVNVLGSLLIGLLWAVLAARPAAPEWLRLGLMTGVMGGFTTLSALSLETLQLLHGGAPGAAALNLAANTLLGLGACGLGFWLARLWAAA